MRVETFSCEVCKKQRDSDTNHWWIVTLGDSLVVTPWAKASKEDIEKADMHLCGQEHLVQKVAEWAAQP